MWLFNWFGFGLFLLIVGFMTLSKEDKRTYMCDIGFTKACETR